MSYRTNLQTRKVFLQRNIAEHPSLKIPYRPLYPNSTSSSHYELSDKNWVQSTPHPHTGTPTINELNAYRRKKGLKPFSLEDVRMQSREVRLQYIRDMLRKKQYPDAYWEVENNVLDAEKRLTRKHVVAVLEEQLAILDSTKVSDKENDTYMLHVNSGKYDPRFDN